VKVRTHLLILVSTGFVGALILSLLAFLTIDHHRDNHNKLISNLNALRNEKIFEHSEDLTRMTKGLLLNMETRKFDIHDALNGDEMVLIKEAYNQYVLASEKDREYVNFIEEFMLSDGNTLADYTRRGILKTRIDELEKSLMALAKVQVDRISPLFAGREANRLKKEVKRLENKSDELNKRQQDYKKLKKPVKEADNLKKLEFDALAKILKAKAEKITDKQDGNRKSRNKKEIKDFKEKYGSAVAIINALEQATKNIRTGKEIELENQFQELDEEKKTSMIILAILVFAFFCIIGVISFSTYKTLANPIRKLEKAATNAIDLNLPFTMKETGPYEIRSLTRRLQGLVLGLEETVKARTAALQKRTFQLQDEISQRKELETQLIHAQKMEAVGQLASGIAHEINSPSQFANDNILFLKDAVEGFIAEIDKTDKAPDEKEIVFLKENAPQAVEQASEGIDRITTIVKSMKNFAYRDAASEKKSNDLNQAIRATSVVATNEWKYHAELQLKLDETTPMVPCNIGEINQVVLNLIVNGAHAIRDRFQESQKGELVVTTKYYAEQGCVVISISDNGGGIPEKVQNRIFEPFFTTKDVGVGTGQGLAIAHNVIVKSHGGQIWFDSKQGIGTTFYVKLFMQKEKEA
jgi:signal transduction histidine kinase